MYSCFHSVGLPKQTLLQVIEMAADAGYQAIEINCETLPWSQPHMTPATGQAERLQADRACRSRGLTIPAIGAHIKMVSQDPELRKAAVDFVNGCTDIAVDMNSPIVHILSGPADDGVDQKEAWKWFRSAVEETADYADRKGKVLAIEAIVGHVFNKVDDYHQMRRELPGVPFRVNFDPSHLIVQSEDPMRVVNELGDQIVHVHLKDGRGLYPKFEFPPLGKGGIDFEALYGGLLKAEYRGALSVEYEAQVFGYQLSDQEILSEGKTFIDKLANR